VILNRIKQHKFFRPAGGAALAVLCGVLLHQMPGAQSWADASYDYLFRFGARDVKEKVVVVQMDELSAQALNTERLSWDRGRQAQLVNKLTDSGCRWVVFDVWFRRELDSGTDDQLVEAIKRHGRVVLAAHVDQVAVPGGVIDQVIPPHEKFLAATTNWGIGKLDTATAPVRRHWTFPAPIEGRPSLAWTTAKVSGAKLSDTPQEQWLRYYGDGGGLEVLSYQIALSNAPAMFRDRIVFIGSKPRQDDPGVIEDDKFLTPYTRWSDPPRAVGGVELLATEFLNLVNHDWLRRASRNVERVALVISGVLLAFGLSWGRRGVALLVGAGAVILFTLGGVCLSYYTNYWFPWLIIVGGQVPCALAWALVVAPAPARPQVRSQTLVAKDEINPPGRNKTFHLQFPEEPLPDAPEYELITPHIGQGGFGKVWIARNAIGQWQALKAVYQSKFGQDRGPYEAEFKGLQRYKPVSEKHPGLLRIDLVSRMKEEGYFYYVMELGDAQAPGWETQPQLYKPRDLENLRKQAFERRVPLAECLRIVTILADALNFLHEQKLTHRDIKPSNVIFVNGRPKLADIGLVADIRPVDEVQTMVGTLGYLPPPPEKPGTAQADIYALGMLLYVISTGRDPGFFPDLSTTLMERSGHAEFVRLNAIILKACQPDLAQRYQTTAEMLRDLRKLSPESAPMENE
jgi:CHASE2 domain-containing sensor protein